MDRLHDETTLKKYKIDATERIIKSLGLKEVKINQFSSDKSGLESYIPTIKSGWFFNNVNAFDKDNKLIFDNILAGIAFNFDIL